MAAPPSSSSSLSLSIVQCSSRAYCCEYCERDHIACTSHEEHCFHPTDSPSLHFLLREGDRLWDIHPACLNVGLVHRLLPLAHCSDILGYDDCAPLARLLIRCLVLHKLSEFHRERELRVAAVFDRDPAAIADRFGERLTCAVCHLVLYHPVELGCAHLLCEGCWVHCMRHSKDIDGGSLPCPTCRSLVNVSWVRHSPAIQLMVQGLQARCVHHVDGCDALVVVGQDERQLRAHLSRCAFEKVQCSQCGRRVERMELHDQRDLVDRTLLLCPLCHQQGSYTLQAPGARPRRLRRSVR